jgi:hypothetical protein
MHLVITLMPFMDWPEKAPIHAIRLINEKMRRRGRRLRQKIAKAV